jgi:hypothetical protein
MADSALFTGIDADRILERAGEIEESGESAADRLESLLFLVATPGPAAIQERGTYLLESRVSLDGWRQG